MSLLSGEPARHPVEANVFAGLEQLVAARIGFDDHLISLDTLVQQFPHARDDARAMQTLGIIALVETGADGAALSLPDAQLVSVWGKMRSAGFVEALDFVPDMLGFNVQAAEFVAG